MTPTVTLISTVNGSYISYDESNGPFQSSSLALDLTPRI